MADINLMMVYCALYILVGCGLWELHCVTMKVNRFCWLFWPDVDVKFIDKEFVSKHVSARFFLFIFWLWPFRLLHILLIFVARGVGLIIISFVTIFLLVFDFFAKKKEAMKIADHPHSQDMFKNTD